jgi:diadenosine tetraphosphate (Ap4A) HIT family hydrolase
MSNNCPFCLVQALTLVAENDLAFAVRDKFPVRPLHTLVIPKRHVADIFETSLEEREAIHQLALECRAVIFQDDPEVQGFNFGSNVGAAAGQKIFHAHLHLIPRRIGDTPPPPARPSE